MPRLLVIDDEPNLQYSLVKSLHSSAARRGDGGHGPGRH